MKVSIFYHENFNFGTNAIGNCLLFKSKASEEVF